MSCDSGGIHHVYRAGMSHQSNCGTVSILNEGTPEYNDRGMDLLLDELDLLGFVKEHCGDTSSNHRGNYQKNFGSSGSQNVGVPTSENKTLLYFGGTYPRNNRGTDTASSIRIQELAARIGKSMNIDFCGDGYLDSHPQHARYFDFVKDMAGTSKARFGAFSLTMLPLTQTSRVNRHRDLENCHLFTKSLLISEITFLEGEWMRVNLIFYMRKAISDMCIRVAACEEAGRRCLGWLENVESYRKPAITDPLRDVAEYYRYGVGSEGIYMTIDKSTKQIVSLALRSKACAEKQGNFLAPLVCSIRELIEHHDVQFATEFIEIVSVIGHLCSLYVFVTVLHMMQEDWDRNLSKVMRGGLVEYIFERMKAITGCVSGGPGRRCMNFLNKNIPVGDIRTNCLCYHDRIGVWLRDAASAHHLTDKQKRDNVHRTLKRLNSNIKWAGLFSVAHVVQTLALMGIAPAYCLDYAVISPGTSQHKKEKPGNARKRKRRAPRPEQVNPRMEAYLSSQGIPADVEEISADGKARSSKAGKLGVVLASLTRYLRVALKAPNLAESTAENMLCEATRKDPAEDLFFPGHGFFRRSAQDGKWMKITPWLKKDAKDQTSSMGCLEYISEEIGDPRERMVESPSTSPTTSVIWDRCIGSSDERLDAIVDIGKKSGKSEKYLEVTISATELAAHPVLLDEIKIASACHEGSLNNHREFMDRLNALPKMVELVSRLGEKKKHNISCGKKDANVPDTKLTEAVSVDTKTSTDAPRNKTESECTELSLENWQRGSPRLFGKINYRIYQTKEQMEGTVLRRGWRGWCTAEDFDGVRLFPWSIPHNDARNALNSNLEGSEEELLPRLKNGENVCFKKEKASMDNTWWYHASLEFLPDKVLGGLSQCLMQEEIALSLGGIKRPATGEDLRFLWFFPSEDTAAQHLMFSIICLCGTDTFYNRLRRRILSKFGSSSNPKHASSGKTAVIGYNVVGCKPTPPGTVAYYLLTDRTATKDGPGPKLVIAFPARQKKKKAVHSKILFVRLM